MVLQVVIVVAEGAVVRNSSDAAAAAADPAAGLDARLSRLLRPLAGLGPLCQT